MASPNIGHATGSPIAKINKAWRYISVVGITALTLYFVLGKNQKASELPPGAFTGEVVQPVERKSKYEGAGNSYFGHQRAEVFSSLGTFNSFFGLKGGDDKK